MNPDLCGPYTCTSGTLLKKTYNKKAYNVFTYAVELHNLHFYFCFCWMKQYCPVFSRKGTTSTRLLYGFFTPHVFTHVMFVKVKRTVLLYCYVTGSFHPEDTCNA